MKRFGKKKANILKVEKAHFRRETLVRALGLVRPLIYLSLCIAAVLFVRKSLGVSPHFVIKSVEVNRCEHVSPEELGRFIDIYPGLNIFNVDIGRTRQRIMQHPWVARARVQRILPDAVRILVTERKPVAFILLSSDESAENEAAGKKIRNLYFVDSEGKIFKQAAAGEALDLPVLTGFVKEEFFKDKATAEVLRQRLREAVKLLNMVENENDIELKRISEVRFSPGKGFSLFIDHAQTHIEVGLPPFDDALTRLDLVTARLGPQARQASRIDLTQPGQAIVKGLREKGKT